MFGRDLTEQVRADSKVSDRMVPLIVEKCIAAVDTTGKSPPARMDQPINISILRSPGLRGYLSQDRGLWPVQADHATL
jgi:hypothetical protein